MSVPLLQISDIRNFLNHVYNLQLTNEDLKKPTAKMVLTVFECFLKDFNFDIEALSQVPFSQIPETSSLEISDTTIAAINFLKAMSYTMELALFPDFNLKDIIELDGKRIRRIFCHLINFWRYYTKQEPIMRSISKKYENLAKKEKRMDREIDACKQEVNQLVKKSSELEAQVQAVEEPHKEILVQMENLKQQAVLLQKQKQENRLKMAEVNDKIANLQVNFVEVQSNLQEAQSQLVNSPERLRAELQAIEMHCEEMENSNAALREKIAEKVKDCKTLAEHRDLANSMEQHLNLMEQDLEHFEEKYTVIRDMESQLAGNISELNALEMRKQEEEQDMRRELQYHGTNTHRLENRIRQLQEIFVQLDQEIADSKNQRKSEEEEEQQWKDHLDTLHKKIAEEEQRRKELEAKFDQDRKAFIVKLCEVEQHYQEEFAAMHNGISNTAAKIKAHRESMQRP